MNTWLCKLSVSTLSFLALIFSLSQSPAQADIQDSIPKGTVSLSQNRELTNSSSQQGAEHTVVPNDAVPELETTPIPVPGTATTSASALQMESVVSQPIVVSSELTEPAPVVAQSVSPGRATRSGPSYIAVGGNIGFGGRTALGRGNFVITSKIGLTNLFSARPGLVVGRSPTILLPVTVDFPVRSAIGDRVSIAPFVGGGLAISTRGGSAVRALATGGIDVPLTSQFTATASANAAFFRRPEIGVILGVGYNF